MLEEAQNVIIAWVIWRKGWGVSYVGTIIYDVRGISKAMQCLVHEWASDSLWEHQRWCNIWLILCIVDSRVFQRGTESLRCQHVRYGGNWALGMFKGNGACDYNCVCLQMLTAPFTYIIHTVNNKCVLPFFIQPPVSPSLKGSLCLWVHTGVTYF